MRARTEGHTCFSSECDTIFVSYMKTGKQGSSEKRRHCRLERISIKPNETASIGELPKKISTQYQITLSALPKTARQQTINGYRWVQGKV